MAAFGLTKEKIITPNVRVLSLPILSLFLLVVLFIFAFKLAYAQITSQAKEIEETKETIIILEDKLELLRQVKDNILSAADTSMLAVPPKNPSLTMLSQLSVSAQDAPLVLTERKAAGGHQGETGLLSSVLTIKGQGELDKAMTFLGNLSAHAPLSTVREVELDEKREGSVDVSLELAVYSAKLPTKLPAITEPIKNLTSNEQKLLNELAKLKPPKFVILSPTGPFERLDPFN